MKFFGDVQGWLYGGANAELRGLATGLDPIKLFAAMALAATIGMIHALMPGHGKTVIVSYYLGRPAGLLGSIGTSAILVLTHVGSAVVLVLAGFTVIRRTIGGAGRAPGFEIASAVLIISIGLWLLFRALHPHEHAHAATDGRVLAFVTGLVPCPLTTFIMVYATAQGIIAAGLLVTRHGCWNALFALAAVLLHDRFMIFMARTDCIRRRVGRCLEVAGVVEEYRQWSSMMNDHRHDHPHDQGHDHSPGHGHTHGIVDPSITTSDRGLWAIKWSFVGLAATAMLQLFVVFISGSVALLADTIHNFADAATAIPLAVAFWFGRKEPTARFSFGYGRVEDLAGVAIVVTILASAIVAGYESIQRLLQPQDVSHLWAVIAASILGFLGNEGVAIFRIRVGREIHSAALIADGYHARVDGWTSLAVLFGALGVWLGYPLADPIVGLLITAAIFGIVLQSGKSIFIRMLDGAEPHVIDEIRHRALHVAQVKEVTEVRARWLGHRLHVELNIAVDPELTIAQAHAIAAEVRHQLLHHLDYLSLVVIHVDPADQSGEAHHHIAGHIHDGLPMHSHV